MASPFRRARPKTLTAAGQRVNMSDTSAIDAVLKSQEGWYKKAYDSEEACGEIYDGVDNIANLVARIRIFGAEQPAEKDAEPARTSNKIVNDTVARLGSVVDQSALLYDYAKQMVLVGDCNLIGIRGTEEVQDGVRDNPAEKWFIASVEETEKASFHDAQGVRHETIAIKEYSNGKDLILRPDLGDTWIRLWRRSSRKRNQATSAIRPILTHVEELLFWDAFAASTAQHRISLSGLIGVPTNLELPAETEEDARLDGATRFVNRLFRLITTNIKNPKVSAVPFVFSYPHNENGKSGIDVISLERPMDELLEKRTDRSLRRIAQGFPLPPEKFFGTSEVSYQGVGTIAKEKYHEYVEPFVLFLMTCLTQAWFLPILRQEEEVENPEQYMLWPDVSALIVHPDMGQAADKGIEYGAITRAAWRRTRGFPEADAPSEAEAEEVLEWLRGLRGRDQTSLQLTQSPDGEQRPVDEPEGHPNRDMPAPPLRTKGQQKNREPVRTAAANGDGMDESINHWSTDLGYRLACLDADLLTRVQVMCDSSMRRAQELAGNRLKSRAQKNPRLKASLRNVDCADVASTLGREATISLGIDDLFEDAFDDVPERFCNWADRTVQAAFQAAGMNPQSDPSFEVNYAPDEAALSLVRDLKELAAVLLFDKTATLTTAPESSDMLVPTNIIRRALAKAGGMPAEGKPHLLLATGHAVSKTLAINGLFNDEWVWLYPSSPRTPYEVHRRLDGETFDVDHSPHQPGDVAGCSCLAVPLFKS